MVTAASFPHISIVPQALTGFPVREFYLSKFLLRWMGHFASELIFSVELFTFITIDSANI